MDKQYVVYTHTYIYIYTMEYYSAARRKEIPPFVTRCMDFEGIMLISLTGKDKYCMVSLICETKKILKLTETESRKVVRS